MRRLWMAVFLCACVLLCASCHSDSVPTESMVRGVTQKYREIPFGDTVYRSGALPGEKAYMSKRLCSLLYDGGREREIPEMAGVLDYSVALSDGQYGAELHVFYMKSEEEARRMEKLLCRRAELLKRRSLYLYAPAAYEKYLSSAAVMTKDRYVFLLATGNNEAVYKTLVSMLY